MYLCQHTLATSNQSCPRTSEISSKEDVTFDRKQDSVSPPALTAGLSDSVKTNF